jgi:hypothetical protein
VHFKCIIARTRARLVRTIQIPWSLETVLKKPGFELNNGLSERATVRIV